LTYNTEYVKEILSGFLCFISILTNLTVYRKTAGCGAFSEIFPMCSFFLKSFTCQHHATGTECKAIYYHFTFISQNFTGTNSNISLLRSTKENVPLCI